MSPTSCARLRDARALAALGLAAGIAVPAALLGGSQAVAHPAHASLAAGTAAGTAAEAADEQPACGDPGAKEFPIEARIQNAPTTYASGGGYGTWFLDLTNTTDTACRALHPVLVLNDEDRKLTTEQIQLKFSEPGRPGTEHRVTWETTDRHEQIGVFDGDPGPAPADSSGSSDDSDSSDESDSSDDGFLGFTVPAGTTVSVRVRMAFTSDTAPGRVTAHAAVVQRRHQDKAKGGGREDGDWVGESGAYRFVIVDGATGEVPRPERTEEDSGDRTDVPAEPRPRTDTSSTAPTPTPTPTRAPTSTITPTPTPTYTGPGKEPAPSPSRLPRPDGSPAPREDAGGKERPARPPHYATGRPLPELARTGPELLPWAGATAAALVLCGGALVMKGRRMRRPTG
ncbi:peptidase [Streptomyces sp. ME02-6991-2A]|uniref:peptidase n=1 Tax=Streptomyces sp. ME02-6991-2A TaxID=3028677 RepID=UPI0029A8F0BA|nr:peptidase [Streptomyces sp. ME02-6991-2A]MDX3375164.1 peptidase [Streptomyces sp. ME02-6991-2A]